MALAELCLKMGKTDEAINTAKMLLGKAEGEITTAEVQPEQTAIPTEEEVLAQLDADTAAMDSAIADGRIDENMGDAAEVNYDENGQPVRNYPDGVFGDDGKTLTVNGLELDGGTPEEISRARIDKARFILLSCYAVKEDYKEVLNISKDVKNSENPYYAFFGRYSEAFSMMKLAEKNDGFTVEQAKERYDEDIAFFRTEMLKRNENSAYAVIFRARMYAESGKYVKAEEMAELMNDEDKAAVTEYIAQCREEKEGKK